MAAYLISNIEVTDAATYEEYKKGVAATIAAYGGRSLARPGATMEVLEGDWVPKRLVILEFPSVERANAWYDSPEYAPAKALRQATSTADLIIVEGFAG